MISFLCNRRMLSLVACAFAVCSLVAEIPSSEPENSVQEEHAVLGSRPIDPEVYEKIEAHMLQEAYENEVPKDPLSELQNPISFGVYKIDKEPAFRLASAVVEKPQLISVSYPLSCHWLSWKSTDARHVKIEDGSTWEVASGDIKTISQWRSDDALFIVPCSSWWWSSKYKYYLMNRTNNTYVKANIVGGPDNMGPYSHWVTGIMEKEERKQVEIWLENQTIWLVDPLDQYLFWEKVKNPEWQASDHVIIILNDKPSEYDHVLINIPLNLRVRVKAK